MSTQIADGKNESFRFWASLSLWLRNPIFNRNVNSEKGMEFYGFHSFLGSSEGYGCQLGQRVKVPKDYKYRNVQLR